VLADAGGDACGARTRVCHRRGRSLSPRYGCRVSAQPVRIIGSVLVRNEDVFIARAIRNIAHFCDRIYAFDHVSTDSTWEILRDLAGDLDHLEVRRSRRSPESHAPIERHAGSPVWAIGVDGDELYDPRALRGLREELLAGAHSDVFRLKGHVLNCETIDRAERKASVVIGPSLQTARDRISTAAVESWPGVAAPPRRSSRSSVTVRAVGT
jgi:hypothetical protein